MALIPCPECGRDVSTMAPACPGCGVPLAATRLNDDADAPDGSALAFGSTSGSVVRASGTRRATQPMFWPGVLIIILGVVLLSLSVILGVIVILGGAMLDRRKYHCSACGNDVGKHATICGTCGTGLH